jgi:hypothetical protein
VLGRIAAGGANWLSDERAGGRTYPAGPLSYGVSVVPLFLGPCTKSQGYSMGREAT